MKRWTIFAVGFLFCRSLSGQVRYELHYVDSSSKRFYVIITPASPIASPVTFIMPRSVPGFYGGNNYHNYVEDVIGLTDRDSIQPFVRDLWGGPRWTFTGNVRVKSVRYVINTEKMEQQELSVANCSVIRDGYIGILNYSVFGWIDGTELQRVQCTVSTFSSWPIFSTVSPEEMPLRGRYSFSCENYYRLADGQTLAGPLLRVKMFPGVVPVYVAAYSEGQPDYIDDIGWRGVTSAKLLKDVFGQTPFSNYSIVKQAVQPVKKEEGANLAMEHLNSATFLSDLSGVNSKPVDSAWKMKSIFPVLHHMAHAYLPLRCYGDAYAPYVQEVPPIIKTVWFNEGFIWFLCWDLLQADLIRKRVQAGVSDEIPALKKLDLLQLSELGSLQYGDDFRIGVANFSRGAMMAMEMNDAIKSAIANKRSMREVLRYLFDWVQKNKRGFTMEELPRLLNDAAGTNITPIYEKWLKPLQ